MITLGKLRKTFLGGLPEEVAAFKNGKTKAEQYLGKIFFTVIRCYHAALKNSRLAALVPQLNEIEPELRGFAYEGAGMGLMQLDCLLPWKKRLQAFLAGPGSPYIYPAYVGAGLALARLRKHPERFLGRLDPVLCWAVVDGYGFRYGIFSRRRHIEEQEIPVHLSPYARRVFDQGLGRSIWFSTGADVDRIAAIIAPFQEARQADLWSGVGFACAYAGGAERPVIEALRARAGSYLPQLAMGAAVGAKGRERAGNLAPHTELACEILCGLSGGMAAHITDVALQNLSLNGAEPAHKIWRQRIEAQFGMAQERKIDSEERSTEPPSHQNGHFQEIRVAEKQEPQKHEISKSLRSVWDSIVFPPPGLPTGV